MEPGLDLGRIEVFRHRIASIAEGMGASLQRAAFSPNIKERLDFSCAVFDGQGRLLAQAAHIPVHLGAMPASLRAARAQVDEWPSGDVLLLNDPQQGGSHLPDLTTISRVQIEDDGPAFYLASRAHHADVGGVAPGSMPLTREIFGEGLILPPVWLERSGQIQSDLLSVICANSRTSEERRGDILAQLAAHRFGSEQLESMLCGRRDALAPLCKGLLEHGRRLAQAKIAELPEGSYRAEASMEDDGLGGGPFTLHLTLRIGEARIQADFSGSAAVAAGGINAPPAVSEAAAYYALCCLLDGLPINAGSLSTVEVITRPGSILNPPRGAAVAGGNVETSQRLVDLLMRALAKAAPDRVPTDSLGTMNNLTIGAGLSGDAQSRFAYYETMGGGCGASPVGPGASALQVHMTNTRNTPIETLETAYPLRVERYAIRRGSGGAGSHAGGDGLVREIRCLQACHVTLLTERRALAAQGAAGGKAGQLGENRLIPSDGSAPRKLPAKGSVDLEAGDRICIATPGGGGWGEPED